MVFRNSVESGFGLGLVFEAVAVQRIEIGQETGIKAIKEEMMRYLIAWLLGVPFGLILLWMLFSKAF